MQVYMFLGLAFLYALDNNIRCGKIYINRNIAGDFKRFTEGWFDVLSSLIVLLRMIEVKGFAIQSDEKFSSKFTAGDLELPYSRLTKASRRIYLNCDRVQISDLQFTMCETIFTTC